MGEMRGKVFLIGAGPGDPELMTLKAARALGRCDVVLIDDLVNRGCLAHARSDARVIEVGKRAGCASTSQEFILKLCTGLARNGKTVGRLKGGDPFVFGRGGEELLALRSQGIDVEVIPGVSAGTGVPAALGIPVTHRGVAHGVTFVTGHGVEIDWAALVRSRTTLVIYMGLMNIRKISLSLIEGGMDPATPACVIENGTLPSQKQVISTVGGLSAAGLAAPALIVVGDVVALANKAVEPKAKAA